MSEFQELIKNFDKIRDYMRQFYVYGFKVRSDFDAKSARKLAGGVYEGRVYGEGEACIYQRGWEIGGREPSVCRVEIQKLYG